MSTSDWNPLVHGSNSLKAQQLVRLVTDSETGLIEDMEMTPSTLAAAQVYALLAIEDAIRDGVER